MAAPQCMSQDGNTAVFVGTMLQTGDAVALCDECLVPWSAALLQAMTGVDPTPFLQAVSEPEVAADEAHALDLEELHPVDPFWTDGTAEPDPTPAGASDGESSTGAAPIPGALTDHDESSPVLETSHGAPTDEPPVEAPADADESQSDIEVDTEESHRMRQLRHAAEVDEARIEARRKARKPRKSASTT